MSENRGSAGNSKKVENEKVNKPKNKTTKKDVKQDGKKLSPEKPVSKEFKITVPNKEIEKEFNNAAEKYSTEMKMDGFRKGKIPVEVVKSKYREVIIDEVINKLIEDYTFKKIKEEKIQIVSSPVVKDFDYKEGKDLSATVSVDLFPEVILPDISKIKLKIKKELFITEEFDEKHQIEHILENNKTRKKVNERKIKEGDTVEFKIQSQFADTKRMMSKKDSFFEVKKEPHPEIGDLFDDLINKSVNDKIEIKRKYNKDYVKKMWAGKTIIHFIEIKNVLEYVKPEFNEDFVKSIGFQDIKTFKAKMKEEYDTQVKRNKDQIINTEIREKLLEECKFHVPASIVDQEVQRTQSQYYQVIMSLPEDKREEYISSIRETAEKSIKFSFILEEIKKQNNIKVENEDLEKEFKMIADINRIDVKEVRKYYMNNEQRESLKDSIGRNRAIDLLKEKISIQEV